MKKLYIITFLILFVFYEINSQVLPNFVQASEKSLSSVVHIESVEIKENLYRYYDPFFGNLYFNDPREQMSSGSGVIVSNDGYIVTNFHVVSDSKQIFVTLNNKDKYEAEYIAGDENTDIALLKINSNNLDAIEFYNSDKVKVGEWVLAIGNPYNLNSTVTAGIVSAKSRNINILHNPRAVESFIQTDAVINPGNSGGALVNLEGELIGLNTAIQSNTGSYTGYGFSIPSNLVYNVVEDLKEFGYVRRAFIGVQVQDINNFISEKYDLDNNKGVLISKVIENGSAIESGIKDLDVILAINNININSVSELQEKICQFDPGDTIQCLIKRKLKKFTINIKLK